MVGGYKKWQLKKKTPIIDQQIFEVLEEPFVWYEEPIVIEKGAIPAQKQGLKILVTKKAEKTSTRSWVSAIWKVGNKSINRPLYM